MDWAFLFRTLLRHYAKLALTPPRTFGWTIVSSSLLLSLSPVQRRAGVPWLLVTLLTLVVDLACAGLALTDLRYPDEVTGFTCPDLAAASGARRTLTILTLVLVFSRGGLVWLLNLSLFISVALLYVRLVTRA